MHADRRVEVRLRRSRLHRDARELDQLARGRLHAVHPQHDVRRPLHDELHQRALVAAGERVLEPAEVRAVDVDVAGVGFAGLRFGEPAGAHGGGGEDRGGDVFVVGGPRFVAEFGVGEAVALGERNGREVHAVGRVADAVDGGDVGLAVVVDDDFALLPKLHTNLLEPQILRLRQPPRRVHHLPHFAISVSPSSTSRAPRHASQNSPYPPRSPSRPSA
mmetsp:Transcript_22493/g.55745  ORF Transcript_22493/g.55745 Transcript_22493/m.55745 type:complete len:218 (+) Transcript_22493:548-1201(+)